MTMRPRFGSWLGIRRVLWSGSGERTEGRWLPYAFHASRAASSGQPRRRTQQPPFVETTKHDYDSMFAINAKAAYFFIQEAGKRMTDGGKITMIVTSRWPHC